MMQVRFLFAAVALLAVACAPGSGALKSSMQPSALAPCNVPGAVRWESGGMPGMQVDFGPGCADGPRVTAAVTLPGAGQALVFRVIPTPGDTMVKLSAAINAPAGSLVTAQIWEGETLIASQKVGSGALSISAPMKMAGVVKVAFDVRSQSPGKITLSDMFVSTEKSITAGVTSLEGVAASILSHL